MVFLKKFKINKQFSTLEAVWEPEPEYDIM
jgi:hypothetical protein